MRHAVIFSSFVPKTDVALRTGAYFLDLLKRHNAEDDIYLGINTGSCDQWDAMASTSGLNVKFAHVQEHLSCDSDVAGFQAALNLARKDGFPHDYYWFGHSKGVSHQAYSDAELLRSIIERDFWCRRAEVQRLVDPEKHGTFGSFFTPPSDNQSALIDVMRRLFLNDHWMPVGLINMYTFFGMTGASLREIFRRTSPDLLRRNLISDIGVHRYFFEGGFSWLADMCGFRPVPINLKVSRLPLSWITTASSWENNARLSAKKIENWSSDWNNYAVEPVPHYQNGNIHLNHAAADSEVYARGHKGDLSLRDVYQCFSKAEHPPVWLDELDALLSPVRDLGVPVWLNSGLDEHCQLALKEYFGPSSSVLSSNDARIKISTARDIGTSGDNGLYFILSETAQGFEVALPSDATEVSRSRFAATYRLDR
jgi:hypothetical protein